MTAILPPLIRLPVNHHDPFLVALREVLSERLIGAIAKAFDADSATKHQLKEGGVNTIMVGGSASLNTPRHPQDIDLYLDGIYSLADKEMNNKRLQAIRGLLEEVAEAQNVKVDHVYVRDEASKAPGLQKITIQAVFEPRGESANNFMAAVNHPIHMPFKIEVHHEREKLFLPPIALSGHEAGVLKAIDPRMVILQKLNRLFDPTDTLKGTDIVDIAHLVDNKEFDPSDPLMRKLGIAAMASDGILRNPVSMDFLIPRGKSEEVAILRQDLEVNISRDVLARYSDDDLAVMIEKVRNAVRTIYPVKATDAELAKPIAFADAVKLSGGEQQFIDGIFKGKAYGAGSARAIVQAEKLFDNMPPRTDIITRIYQDAGLRAEVEETNGFVRKTEQQRS